MFLVLGLRQQKGTIPRSWELTEGRTQSSIWGTEGPSLIYTSLLPLQQQRMPALPSSGLPIAVCHQGDVLECSWYLSAIPGAS